MNDKMESIQKSVADNLQNTSKKFECTLCFRKFIQKRHMKNHLYQYHAKAQKNTYQYEEVTFNGRKVFSCSMCSTQFRQKRSIVQHQIRDHNMASPTRDIEIQTEFAATALVNLEPEDLPSSQSNMSTVSVETNMDLSDENKSSMSNETADSSDMLSEHDYIDHNSGCFSIKLFFGSRRLGVRQ